MDGGLAYDWAYFRPCGRSLEEALEGKPRYIPAPHLRAVRMRIDHIIGFDSYVPRESMACSYVILPGELWPLVIGTPLELVCQIDPKAPECGQR